jgi:hypothetical protein
LIYRGITQLNGKWIAAGPDHVHGLMSAIGIDMLHHTVNVIFHRKFGQIQGRGDFFIRHPLRHQGHQLALAESQPQALSLLVLLLNKLEQGHAKRRRANSFTMRDRLYRRNNFNRRRFLEQIRGNAQPHCFQKVLWVFIHAEQNLFDLHTAIVQILTEALRSQQFE